MSEESGFREWVILELLGHRRMAGLLSEQEIAGAGFLRIDVPETEQGPASTHFFSPASVYAINPTTEEVARATAHIGRPEPVNRWELPSPRHVGRAEDPFDPYESEDDEDDGEGETP